MSHKNNNRLYNYLVNTFGISKKMVMEYVDQRLEDLVSKHVISKLDSKYVEKMILDRVTQIVTEGVTKEQFGGLYYKKEAFDAYLKKVLANVVENKLIKDYEIELKLTNKNNNVVRKV